MSVRLFEKGGLRVNENIVLEALQADAKNGQSNEVYVVDDKATNTVKVLMNEGRVWELFSAATKLEKDRESRYSDYDQMEEDPIISSALELVVDDATQYSNEMNGTLWIGGKHKYGHELQEFLSTIDFENKVWGWTYNIAKYGDFMLRVYPKKGEGITNIRESEHPKSVYRIDIDGKLACFIKKDISARKEEIMDSSGYVHFINNFKPNFESVKVKMWEDEMQKSVEGEDKTGEAEDEPAEYGDKTKDTKPFDKSTWDVDSGDPQKSPSRRMIDANRRGDVPKGERKLVEKILTSMYGTSILQNARLIYRILNLLEVSLALARLARSPLIRVFYVNTEGMTKDERRDLIQDLEQKFMQKKAIDIPVNFYRMKYNPLQYNDEVFIPYTGTKGDMRVETVGGDVNIKDIVDIEYIRDKLLAAIRIPGAFLGMCLRGNTGIRLCDGTTPTIREMFENKEYFRGKTIFTSDKDGRVHATNISDINKTRLNAKYVRVHLDNGEYFDVTPDHRCMLRDGSYKEAEKLVSGESLMPLYYFELSGAEKGYYGIIDNKDRHYVRVHRLVAEDLLNGGKVLSSEQVVHHRDKVKSNNDALNLAICENRREHFVKYHPEMASVLDMGRSLGSVSARKRREAMSSEERLEYSKRMSVLGKGRKKPDGFGAKVSKSLMGINRDYQKGENNPMANPEYREKARQGIIKAIQEGRRKSFNYMKTISPDSPEFASWKGKMVQGRWGDYHPQEFEICCDECGKMFMKKVPYNDISSYLQTPRFCCVRCQRVCRAKANSKMISERKMAANCYNHRVVNVEYLDVVEDAYDLTVESDNHNFSLSCGVFVHNSESIPGFSGSQTLTRLDIRYARMVKKVQRALIEGMYRLFQIHLSYKYSQDISVEDLSIGMVPISSAEEDSRLEYTERKIGIATSMLGLSGEMEGIINKKMYVEYIFKQIFAFPDLDIDKLLGNKSSSSKSDALGSRGSVPVPRRKGKPSGDDEGDEEGKGGGKGGSGEEGEGEEEGVESELDILQEEGDGSNGSGTTKVRAEKIRNLVGSGFWIKERVNKPSHSDLRVPAIQERAKLLHVRSTECI